MRKEVSANELQDNAFNRYTFAGDESAPSWFAADEERHMRSALPITDADVRAVQAEQVLASTRPIKKIVEAKFRKQRASLRRLERQKAKADTILTSDVSDREKMQQLEKLARGKKKKDKLDKVYVVMKSPGNSHTAVKTSARGRIKMVDSRMRKEMRSKKTKERRAGAKRKR